jgi:hypothetical protein
MIYRLHVNFYPGIARDVAAELFAQKISAKLSDWLPFKGFLVRLAVDAVLDDAPKYINEIVDLIIDQLNVRLPLDAYIPSVVKDTGKTIVTVKIDSASPLVELVQLLNTWVDIPLLSETSEAKEIRKQIANLEKLADANEAQINAILDRIEWKTHDMHLYIEEVAA